MAVSDTSTMSVIEVADGGEVVRLTLNRPSKLNALSDEVRKSLTSAFTDLAERPEVKVVLLAGAGRSFSAGVDLAGAAPAAETWAERRHRAGAWQRLLDLIESVPPVTVARLHGHVVGGAALLAASCDLRIAADDLKMSIPEVALGIPLTWAGLPRLAREIGLPLTRDIVMTGRVMGAEEARRCGYAQRVVPVAELDAATEALVAELVAMPAAPLQMTRAGLRAIGKASGADSAAWADPDLIYWAGIEPEGGQARLDYMRKRGLID